MMMNTTNNENTGLLELESKATRASRCRRAPLCNVTNMNIQNVAVLKKAKKCSEPTKPQPSAAIDTDSYIDDIFQYMVDRETEAGISPDYMSLQPDLKPEMRCILVDWIVQACGKFKLEAETQYYAIQYIDRFLSVDKIERSDLQLVGICAIFIASKFEEISVPSMSDLCYITEDTYTPQELQRMEAKMLVTLDYNLSYPTSIQFVRYIIKILTCSREQYYYAKFLCELVSVSYAALQWKPSEIAVSSLDVLNKVSKFVPVLRQRNFLLDDSSISECKDFMRKMVVGEEMSDYNAVFDKNNKLYNSLKRLLTSL